MKAQEVVMICTCDIAGQVRGKGFPAQFLEARRERGVGWTPTNIMITAHGPIAESPWGPFGDLMLVPDLDTHVRVDFGDGSAPENFVLGDILELDGRPWTCCPRSFLKRGLDALRSEFGLTLKAAFEHEFHYGGVEERPNSSYALDAFRRQGRFAETLLGALEAAGIELDTFMPEYGPSQYEVTMGPADGVRAADQAVILREVARGTAQRFGARVSFTPILRPNAVGNGVHVHFSLSDEKTGAPVNFDASRPHGLTETAGRFLAGILQKLPAMTAISAPATISYLRLVPHRWSAAYNNLGLRDREAGVRICPVFPGGDVARQFHFEFRASDAAANPYLLLGAIVWAGVWGLRAGLAAPEPTGRDPDAMSEEERASLGIVRLPQSLDAALDRLEADVDWRLFLGDDLFGAYLAHKRFEARTLGALPLEEQCERYRLAY